MVFFLFNTTGFEFLGDGVFFVLLQTSPHHIAHPTWPVQAQKFVHDGFVIGVRVSKKNAFFEKKKKEPGTLGCTGEGVMLESDKALLVS